MVDGLLKPRTKPISLISLIVSLDPPNPTKVGFVGLRTWCVAKAGHFQINYNIYIPVRITAPSVDYNLILYDYREKYFIILHLHLILNYLSCTYKSVEYYNYTNILELFCLLVSSGHRWFRLLTSLYHYVILN